MKKLLSLLFLFFAFHFMAFSQNSDNTLPAYCNDLPKLYDKGASMSNPLPKFKTQPVTEYKVQVAILRSTHPSEHPFHKSLVARYRPCEQVWVVESRQSFASRKQADEFRKQLVALGYRGAYIFEMMGYAEM